jgi:hypothetical protein
MMNFQECLRRYQSLERQMLLNQKSKEPVEWLG